MDEDINWSGIEIALMDLGPEDFYLDPYSGEDQYDYSESDYEASYEDDGGDIYEFSLDNYLQGDSFWSDDSVSGEDVAGEGVTPLADDSPDTSGDSEAKSDAEQFVSDTDKAPEPSDIAGNVIRSGEALTPQQDEEAQKDSEANRAILEGGDYGQNKGYDEENARAAAEWTPKPGDPEWEDYVKRDSAEQEQHNMDASSQATPPKSQSSRGVGSGMGRGERAGLGQAFKSMADYKTAMDKQKLAGQQSLEQIEARKAKGKKPLWLKKRPGATLTTRSGAGLINRTTGA